MPELSFELNEYVPSALKLSAVPFSERDTLPFNPEIVPPTEKEEDAVETDTADADVEDVFSKNFSLGLLSTLHCKKSEKNSMQKIRLIH